MNELLALIASLVGDAYDDAAKAKVEAAAKKVVETGSASATDASRAEVKRLEGELARTERRAKKAEDKLADASGDADARVEALRAELDGAKAKVGDLEAEAKRQAIRRRFERALGKAELPEAKRQAALKLADLDGIELDDKSDDGLAGSSAAIERLKGDYAFLWDAGETDDERPRGGGPRKGGSPLPNPPKPKDGGGLDIEKTTQDAVVQALKSRGRAVRGTWGSEAAKAAGA
jgi:hypothetical protein